MENKIKDYFSFAKYLQDYFQWCDNTEEGDMYKCVNTFRLLTESEVFDDWLLDRGDSKQQELYNRSELESIAINYAKDCNSGYVGGFTKWFDNLECTWRDWVREEDESSKTKSEARGNSASPPDDEMIDIKAPVGSTVYPPLKCNPEGQILPPIKEPIKNLKMIQKQLVRWKLGDVVETLKKHNNKLNEIIDAIVGERSGLLKSKTANTIPTNDVIKPLDLETHCAKGYCHHKVSIENIVGKINEIIDYLNNNK